MSSELGSCLINGQRYYEYICTANVMNYTDIPYAGVVRGCVSHTVAATAPADRLFVLWGRLRDKDEEAVYRRVRELEYIDCWRYHVRPSAGNDSASAGRIFVKFCSAVD